MRVSNYVYGNAANNMHGDLSDAVTAEVISEKERLIIESQSYCLLSGHRMKGDFRIDLQFKLDKFFKRDKIDYDDFEQCCKLESDEKFPTICALELFNNGKRCYYTATGETVNLDFTSRFDQLDGIPSYSVAEQ